MHDASTNVTAALRRADAGRHILDLVRGSSPGLTVTSQIATPAPTSPGWLAADAEEAPWLAHDGYAWLREVLPDAGVRAALCVAMERLTAAGLPALFALLLDEPWTIAEACRRRVSALTGATYGLTADAWAWRIPPGEQGWPTHRDDILPCDRKAPERVSAWVALDEVTTEGACMHVVPLADDPAYPDQMANAGEHPPHDRVRALPLAAGSALVWNANLLHWGGACSPRARRPRVSLGFTLVRVEAAERFARRVLRLGELGPGARLQAVASMVHRYSGRDVPDVSPAVLGWARATLAFDRLRGNAR